MPVVTRANADGLKIGERPADAGGASDPPVHSAAIIILADRRPPPPVEAIEHRRSAVESAAVYHRARMLWPRLDPHALARTHGDPRRVARLVARRTVLTEDAIVDLLQRHLDEEPTPRR